jgi:hypothetical protein
MQLMKLASIIHLKIFLSAWLTIIWLKILIFKKWLLLNIFKQNNKDSEINFTQPDKQVLFNYIGSIFVSWYNKELSSWYLAKLRYQVDVYLISIWCLYLFDLILMSRSWKIKVYKSSNRWYLKSLSGRVIQNKNSDGLTFFLCLVPKTEPSCIGMFILGTQIVSGIQMSSFKMPGSYL